MDLSAVFSHEPTELLLLTNSCQGRDPDASDHFAVVSESFRALRAADTMNRLLLAVDHSKFRFADLGI
jgi:hypothetical protein